MQQWHIVLKMCKLYTVKLLYIIWDRGGGGGGGCPQKKRLFFFFLRERKTTNSF